MSVALIGTLGVVLLLLIVGAVVWWVWFRR